MEFASCEEPQAAIMQCLLQGGFTLETMEFEEMSLEDIFLQLTTEEETV